MSTQDLVDEFFSSGEAERLHNERIDELFAELQAIESSLHKTKNMLQLALSDIEPHELHELEALQLELRPLVPALKAAEEFFYKTKERRKQ